MAISLLQLKIKNILGVYNSNGFLDTATEKKIPSNLYQIDLYLPNEIYLNDLKVTEGELTGCDMLIGMDIITKGDFAISNYNGKTTFTFRTPSLETLDFTALREE